MFKFQIFLQTISDTECFAQGECKKGDVIAESITLGENSCLKFCQKVDGCQWFNYNTKSNLCLALSSCPQMVTEGCFECLSGKVIFF